VRVITVTIGNYALSTGAYEKASYDPSTAAYGNDACCDAALAENNNIG